MTKRRISFLLLALLLTGLHANAYNGWQRLAGMKAPTAGKQVLVPKQYAVFATDESSLQRTLSTLSDDPAAGQLLALPMPDGTIKEFTIWRNTTMDKGLGAKYTGIQTFTATARENSRISAKIDFTGRGFHAMIYDGASTSFVDPYSDVQSGYYIAYYRKDYSRPINDMMACLSQEDGDAIEALSASDDPLAALRTINGNRLRTYRLALACTGEYAVAVGGPTPTKTSVLSAMVTSVNRVNGVFERELAISLQLIAGTDTLIFLDGATDPYANNAGDSMLTQNQVTVTTLIGTTNYDLGHVFSTGGGGIASRGCVCRTGLKAMGVTGLPNPVGDAFDIDFVAHEMGHQFGANHPFNNNRDGSCTSNASRTSAYEPGSGSTLMAYAGICPGDNIQTHSDAYFHAKSLVDIVTTITNTAVSACPITTISGNRSLSVPAFNASYSIPYKTPFELTAPLAVDSVANDEKTYCWEQWNLGDFGLRFSSTSLSGPIFRSFLPDTSRTRIFPTLTRLLANTTSYLGEKLPDTARFLTFKLTTRAILNGVGAINIADDTIHLDVINTGTPFAVTFPNAAVNTWASNIGENVTWEVSGTDAAPINCAAVDIFLSVDGGRTYAYQLAAGVPNTGTARVIVPNVTTNTARVKVKGVGNVFFDISNANFAITQGPATTGISNVGGLSGVNVYPQPATRELHIATGGNKEKLEVSLVSIPGQVVWKGTVQGNVTIPVGGLARDLYFLKIQDQSGTLIIKKIILQ